MRVGCLIVFSGVLLQAQPVRPSPPQFDVASIRESSISPGTEGSGRERVDVTPTSVWLRNASLSFDVQWAYGVRFYEISGVGWLKDQRWDILPKTQEAHSGQELCALMRTLLTERFKLILHTEKQTRPVYALVRGKGKTRLQKASPGEPATFGVVDGDFVFTNTTMTELADRLSDFATVDRPVLDKTGMKDSFNFKLESAARAIRGGEGPSIFAVSESGLQMKPANEAVDIVVIDNADKKPSAN